MKQEYAAVNAVKVPELGPLTSGDAAENIVDRLYKELNELSYWSPSTARIFYEILDEASSAKSAKDIDLIDVEDDVHSALNDIAIQYDLTFGWFPDNPGVCGFFVLDDEE